MKNHKLVAHAQPVGDGFGNFRFRNLYEPINPIKSAFQERISVPLTNYMDEHLKRGVSDETLIREHSLPDVGLFDNDLGDWIGGLELYLLTKRT